MWVLPSWASCHLSGHASYALMLVVPFPPLKVQIICKSRCLRRPAGGARAASCQSNCYLEWVVGCAGSLGSWSPCPVLRWPLRLLPSRLSPDEMWAHWCNFPIFQDFYLKSLTFKCLPYLKKWTCAEQTKHRFPPPPMTMLLPGTSQSFSPCLQFAKAFASTFMISTVHYTRGWVLNSLLSSRTIYSVPCWLSSSGHTGGMSYSKCPRLQLSCSSWS